MSKSRVISLFSPEKHRIQTVAEQVRFRPFTGPKRERFGMMSSAEYRVILDRYELSHEEAAKLVKISADLSRRIAAGEALVPVEVENFLRVFPRTRIEPDELKAEIARDNG